MMGGTSILENYTPDVDAAIVERILDAGGENWKAEVDKAITEMRRVLRANGVPR